MIKIIGGHNWEPNIHTFITYHLTYTINGNLTLNTLSFSDKTVTNTLIILTSIIHKKTMHVVAEQFSINVIFG